MDEKIEFDPLEFNHKRWQYISKEAIDIIKEILVKKPALRPSAQDLLEKDYFKDMREQKISAFKGLQLDPNIFRKLTAYKGISTLKKAALNMIVKNNVLKPDKERQGTDDLLAQSIEELKKHFQAIDLDQSGLINARELAHAMKEVNIGLRPEEIDSLIKEIDYVGNGKINYSEFLAATIQIQDTLTEEMLWRLFKKFDVDDSDYISKQNLYDAFGRLGKQNIPYREVEEIIKAHDIKNDGQISFDEFKLIFKDDQ